MNVTKWIRNLWIVATVGLAIWTPSAEALENNGGYTISDVTARQRWPWSRKVDIDFVLAKPEGASSSQGVSIGLVASNGANVVTLSEASLNGYSDTVLFEGNRRIVWDPTVDHSGQSFSQVKFYLTVTATNVEPTYLVVDLFNGAAEYKAASFSNAVNADVYKTDKLALRLLPAGTFTMGEGTTTQSVTLTKAFYAGVFEVTESHWAKVMGGGIESINAKGNVSYNDVRGTSPLINWYTTGAAVSATNFIGLLRARTGLQTFDLPTDAQWEYLCRAGTTTYYNDGIAGSDASQLSVLGWWLYNSGPAVHPGGQKKANRWGLYDTHGNVNEWCLDWFGGSLGGTDPSGPNTGSQRVRRGGNWNTGEINCRSAARFSSTPETRVEQNGFRIVLNMP